MGFGGHAFAMITAIKNNARRRKKNFKDLPTHYEKYKNAHAKPFPEKKISKEKLNHVKSKIRQNLLVERRKEAVLSILLLLFVCLCTVAFVRSARDETMKVINEKKEVQKELVKSNSLVFKEYFKRGNKAAQNHDYKKAKEYYRKAKMENNASYELNVMLTKVYVMDCIENQIDCEATKTILDSAIERYGNMSDLKKLQLLYDSK